jgi:hypothetical protein
LLDVFGRHERIKPERLEIANLPRSVDLLHFSTKRRLGAIRNSLSEQFANLATGGPVERQLAFFKCSRRYLLFAVYAPIILTSTRLRRRPSNSP